VPKRFSVLENGGLGSTTSFFMKRLGFSARQQKGLPILQRPEEGIQTAQWG
jgi:hypothetical protein